jgi:hypothetical protein
VALVLGILGFATVGVFSPMAWAIGHRELAAIEAGKRSPENRLAAQVGRFLGIAGTAVIVVAASLFLLAVAGVIQGT